MRTRLYCSRRTTRHELVCNKIVAVIGACVLASSATGCNAPSSTANAPAPGDGTSPLAQRVAAGQLASNEYFAVRVLNTKVCTMAAHRTPPAGIKKFAVELELQALGAAQVPANPFYATLVDDKAQRFESTALGCQPMLAAPALNNGASARGWVTFDMPESSLAQAVTYQPALIGLRSPRAELELR